MTSSERLALQRIAPLADTDPMAAAIIRAVHEGESVLVAMTSAVVLLIGDRQGMKESRTQRGYQQ